MNKPTDDEIFEVLCYEMEIEYDLPQILRGVVGDGKDIGDLIDGNKLEDLIESTKNISGKSFLHNIVLFDYMIKNQKEAEYYNTLSFGAISLVISKKGKVQISVNSPDTPYGSFIRVAYVLRTLPKSAFYKKLSTMKNKINIPSNRWNEQMALEFVHNA